MKSKILFYSAIGILILTVILNIVLLATPVFKGTYTFENNGQDSKIIFYDNTYTHNYDFGFYQYVKKGSAENVEYNSVILNSCKNSNSNFVYKRDSVFALIRTINQETSETYICGVAVFLQVLYLFLIGASIIVIVINRPYKAQNKELKNDKQ